MKALHYTSQFKKDFKRIKHQPTKLKKLLDVLKLLENEEPIPDALYPHQLKGDYKGCMECHIESDTLLIWIDKDSVDLLRIGSHSELF
jgi:mRNA interferase YafQ